MFELVQENDFYQMSLWVAVVNLSANHLIHHHKDPFHNLPNPRYLQPVHNFSKDIIRLHRFESSLIFFGVLVIPSCSALPKPFSAADIKFFHKIHANFYLYLMTLGSLHYESIRLDFLSDYILWERLHYIPRLRHSAHTDSPDILSLLHLL